jgi:hypothetical protein
MLFFAPSTSEIHDESPDFAWTAREATAKNTVRCRRSELTGIVPAVLPLAACFAFTRSH